MGYTITIGRRVFDLKSVTVEPVMFIYMFNVFLQVITFQALVYDKVCQKEFNTTVCQNLDNKSFASEEDIVQKNTSTWLLYSNITMGIPALLTVLLLLGPWGDRVGRKVPVILPIIGAILSNVSNLVNSVYMSAPLGYLLIGNFCSGIFGGYIGALMSMYTYVAHISSPEYRTIKIGILEAMIFLSGTLGTATSGVMLDRTSYVFVFSLMTGLLIVLLVYTCLWVDNIKPENDSQSEGPANGCGLLLGVLKDVVMCVYNGRHNKNFLNLVLLTLTLFLLMLVMVGENDIILIYTRYHPFEWSQTTLGLFKGTESFLRGMGMLLLMPLCKKVFGMQDTSVMLAGLISKSIALLFIGLSSNTAMMFAGAVTGVLQGFGSAAIRSQCSSMVPSNQQGKMFSLIALFESLASLVATSLFNTVYNKTLDFYHGFSFLMASAIVGIGVAVGIVLHIRIRRDGLQVYNQLEDEHLEIHHASVEPEVET
ncbi:proton-coupled folate transporter-like [Dreissena polymorpha]|uniref:Major facilitator superfamily (MFS) profile domain-containing protein n=1 Tax=Dreissena polymorpha TaxID=45954 RepID=A0A9D4QVN1_DREPO|nr:proton-coupled folate transporter-like [Dreissena polymorpha]KAH3844693.1 hypothetical protein DPMN_086954 [Dreissena polymorpha]